MLSYAQGKYLRHRAEEASCSQRVHRLAAKGRHVSLTHSPLGESSPSGAQQGLCSNDDVSAQGRGLRQLPPPQVPCAHEVLALWPGCRTDSFAELGGGWGRTPLAERSTESSDCISWVVPSVFMPWDRERQGNQWLNDTTAAWCPKPIKPHTETGPGASS